MKWRGTLYQSIQQHWERTEASSKERSVNNKGKEINIKATELEQILIMIWRINSTIIKWKHFQKVYEVVYRWECVFQLKNNDNLFPGDS